MKKNYNISLLAVAALIASYNNANAANTGELTIQGDVPVACDLYISTDGGTTFNTGSTETYTLTGDIRSSFATPEGDIQIRENCNAAAGYTVDISFASAADRPTDRSTIGIPTHMGLLYANGTIDDNGRTDEKIIDILYGSKAAPMISTSISSTTITPAADGPTNGDLDKSLRIGFPTTEAGLLGGTYTEVITLTMTPQ